MNTAVSQPQSFSSLESLPVCHETLVNGDWLIHVTKAKGRVCRSVDKPGIVLENGLIRRVFRFGPNGATVALDNLMTGASLVRRDLPHLFPAVNTFAEMYVLCKIS